MINIWDFENGQENIAEYLNMQEGYAKQGALIATGLMNMGVRDDIDTAKGILTDSIQEGDKKNSIDAVLGGIIGLGFAYAGTCREDLLETLIPYIADNNVTLKESVMAALACGLIFCGDANEDVAEAVTGALMERGDEEKNQTMARFYSVALALLFLG